MHRTYSYHCWSQSLLASSCFYNMWTIQVFISKVEVWFPWSFLWYNLQLVDCFHCQFYLCWHHYFNHFYSQHTHYGHYDCLILLVCMLVTIMITLVLVVVWTEMVMFTILVMILNAFISVRSQVLTEQLTTLKVYRSLFVGVVKEGDYMVVLIIKSQVAVHHNKLGCQHLF